MRRLFVPACLCLAAWAGATASETPSPIATPPLSGHANLKTTKPASLADIKAAPPAHAAPTEPPPSASIDDVKNPEAKAAEPARAKPDAAAPPTDGTSVRRKAPPADQTAVPLPRPKPAHFHVVHRSRQEICNTLANAARTNDLPVPFFIRLLFQESRFKPGAVSRAGAQGIAQLMPTTAADVGVDNPFDPLEAIPAAARLLRDLLDRFGNVGLAAAAYNAGPARVHKWLKEERTLPAETRGYVRIITGQPADNWKAIKGRYASRRLPKFAPCKDVAGLYAFNGNTRIPLPPARPALEIKVAQADIAVPDKTTEKTSAQPTAKTHGKSPAKSAHEQATHKTHHAKPPTRQLAASRHAKRPHVMKTPRHTRESQHLAAR